jgi:hypothetical protein
VESPPRTQGRRWWLALAVVLAAVVAALVLRQLLRVVIDSRSESIAMAVALAAVPWVAAAGATLQRRSGSPHAQRWVAAAAVVAVGAVVLSIGAGGCVGKNATCAALSGEASGFPGHIRWATAGSLVALAVVGLVLRRRASAHVDDGRVRE